MKFGRYLILSLSLLVTHSLFAVDTDEPYLAFEEYMKTVLKTDEMVLEKKDDMEITDALSFLSERYKAEMQAGSYVTRMDQFNRWRLDFSHFEPLYYSVNRKGLRAIVVVSGIDELSRGEAEIKSVMLLEDSKWKIDEMSIQRMNKSLKMEAHQWRIGDDEEKLWAILTGASDKHVELVTMQLKEVMLPMSQISREDAQYVKRMKRTVSQRIDDAKKRLMKKAAKAGQGGQMKVIVRFVRDQATEKYIEP